MHWVEPSNADQIEVTEYWIKVTPQDRAIKVKAPTANAVVSGLRNGTEYEFIIFATTLDGASKPSFPVKATPSTGMEGEVAGLIVKFEAGTAVADGQATVPGEERVSSVDMEVNRHLGQGAVLVALDESVSVTKAEEIAQELESDARVQWAEPDQFLFTANDESVALTNSADMWNLNGRYGIDAPTSPTSQGSGVTVAVIDTGATSHPAINSRLVSGYDFVSSPDALAAVRQGDSRPVAFDADYVETSTFGVVGRDANPADPGDWRGAGSVRASSWHGTKMAGLIASVAPGAQIQPIRALSWRGGLLSDIASAITWASGGEVGGVPANSHPSKIINMSFATQVICPVALQQAIDDARARGSVLIAAAGNANDNASNYAPGNCNGVITVGSSTSDGVRAAYSNYGDVVDLSAPGGDNATPVKIASNSGTTSPETPAMSNDFGTSVSAAHVSAAAAILVGKTLASSPDDVYRTLTGRAHVKPFANPNCDANPDYECGAGILTLNLAQIAAAGDTDYYMNFNGTNQRAKSSGYYPVANGPDQAFTASAWVYDTSANDFWQYIMAQSAGSGSDFAIGTVNGTQNIVVSDWFTGVLLPTDQWVHVAVSRSGTSATLYLNGGVAAVTNNYVPLNNFTNQQFRVGSYIDDRSEYWEGRIDQVKVYNYALSTAEILSDMQSWGAAAGASSSSLIALYDFNDALNATVTNRGYQGTQYGMGNLASENGPSYSELATPSTSGSTTTVIFRRSYLTSFGGWIAPAGVTTSTTLVVGGGGAGGFDGGGGGGGGGVYDGSVGVNAGGANTVIVGQGGVSRKGYNPANNCWNGNSIGAVGCSGNGGTTSQFQGANASGGGGGGGKNANGGNYGGALSAAGAGGGGGSGDNNFVGAGGAGVYYGGNGSGGRMGGGGGGASGAGSAGANFDNYGAGYAGNGVTSSRSGSAVMYGSGGTGGAWTCANCIVAPPSGGGMGGWLGVGGGFATPNQGGGGGGGGSDGTLPGYGGNGVVVVTYSTVPAAPTSLTSTAGQSQVTLSWVAPSYTGGSAVTGYRVQYAPVSGSWSNPSSGTCSTATTSTATSCTITGLTAGTAYTFQMQAINGNGNGSWVQFSSATPFGALSTFTVTTTASAPIGAQVAGTAFNIRITAKDSGGNTVTSFTGTVDLTSTSLFGASSGGTTTAFSAGILASKSITLLRSGTSQTITATQTGASAAGSSAAFAINSGTATQLQTLLPGETAAPGTATGKTGSPTAQVAGASFTTTVNAVDANWNLVASATPTVRLTSSDGAATLPANAPLVSGTKAFTVTLNTMGSQTITAADTSGSSPLTSSTSTAVSVGKPTQATLSVSSVSGTYGSALTLTTSGGSGSGAVTYAAVDGTATGCSVSGTSLTVTQAGTCLVTATKAEDANYAQASSAQTTVTFSKAPQAAFTITSASTVVFGESVTLTTSGGSGTGAVSFIPGGSTGTASCLVSNGSTNSVTGTNAGGTCEVIGEKADDDNYQQVLTAQWVTVTTRPITLTATSPSVDFGSSLGQSYSVTSGSLAFSNAISGMTYTYAGTGSTSYGPSTTAPTAVGTYSVTPSAVVLSNGNAANYDITYAVGTVTISRASQTISFAQPSGVTYGAAPYALAPTSSSGLSVTLTSGTPLACSVASNIVTVVGAGTCTLTAAQAGDSSYLAATDVSRSFAVAQASQSPLSISSASSVAFGGTISLGTTGGSGSGAVTYAVSGPSTCTVNGTILTPGNTGSTCVVTATKAGDTNHTSVSSSAQTITVTQAGQVLAFTSSVPASPVATGSYTPAASSTSTVTGASSGLTPTITVRAASSSVCTISGGTVSFLTSGSCILDANSAATTNFSVASQVSQTIVVGSANQSITFAQPANVTYGSASVSMGATASSNLDVTYTRGSGTTNTACSVSTLGAVTILAVGTCEVVAAQAGDSTYAAASPVSRAFAVQPALPTAPSIASVSAANQSITVGFTAPGFTGGVSISGYQIVATPTTTGTTVTTNSCTISPCSITGLANGTAYTVTVAAINAAGVGPASSASSSITAATSAYAVGALSAIPGNTTVTLLWTALTNPQLGGGTFTRYDVYMRTSGTSTWNLVSNALTSQSADNITIPGLDNGTSYDFRLVAITTANGVQIPGNTTDVVQYASTTTSAPRSVTVLAATATEVQVSWQAPLTDGGAPLVSPYYSVIVTSTNAGASTPRTCVFASATDRFCTASNLTNGAAYTVTVAAINRMGTSTPATTTYNVPSSDASLSNLVVSGSSGTLVLSPAFISATTAYTATVPNSVSTVTVTPTSTMGGSSITVDSAAVTSGSASSAIALAVGINTIQILVTASDPRFTQRYTLTIRRDVAAGGNSGTSSTITVNPSNAVTPPSVSMSGSELLTVTVDGVMQPRPKFLTNTSASGWIVSGQGYDISVAARNAANQEFPKSASGVMRVPQGGSLVIAGSGANPGSDVAVFVIPRAETRTSAREGLNALYLGSAVVDRFGTYSSILTVNASVPVASYVLQVNSVTQANQVRSVNILLNVVAAESVSTNGRQGSLAGKAFFNARSTSFTSRGLSDLKAIVRKVPRGVRDVNVQVIGVSVGRGSREGNLRLAAQRARKLTDYLVGHGVRGRYSVAVWSNFEVRSKEFSAEPWVSRTGKPLSTVRIIYPVVTND